MDNIFLLKLDEEANKQRLFERLDNLKRLLEIPQKPSDDIRERQKWSHEVQLLEKRL